MTSIDIQNVINSANDEDTINFTYSTKYLSDGWTINKNLFFEGNNATITATSDNDVFALSDVSLFSFNNFNIDLNGSQADGISGSGTTENGIITNNVISNGAAGINIFGTYQNLTISGNVITNMLSKYGDGISLIDHTVDKDMDSWIGSTILNNTVDGSDFGIYLGGNFKGTISDNIVVNTTSYGIQFEGKHSASNGQVNATIINNYVNSSSVGLGLDTYTYLYLNIDNNTIQGDDACVEVDPSAGTKIPFIVTNNSFFGAEGDLGALYGLSDAYIWDDSNTLNGTIYNF
jgi:parallel beta-helix repeat protein